MRLIDADALELPYGYCEDASLCYEALRSLPSIDIVRCGECAKHKKNKFCLEHMRYERDDNGFCSYGEREGE